MAEPYNNPFALNFIKKFEGYTPKPAWDHKQYSVGFGTKWTPGSPAGTRADHEAALANEASKVDAYIQQNVKAPLDEGKRAALLSFGYNLGPGAIQRLLPDINAGNWDRVGQRMNSFNKASGQVNPGLVKRRAQEAAMLTGNASPSTYMAANAVNQVATNGAPQAMAGPIGGAPIAGGPVPLTPPNMRYSKLADMLMAQAAGSDVKGWGDALRAAGSTALGYSLANKADTQQSEYKSKLAQALGGASTPEALTQTLLSSGDDDLVKQGVALQIAKNKPQNEVGRFRPSKQGVVDTVTGKIVPGTEAAAAGPEAAEYGTSTVPYTDKDGNLVYTQVSKAGGRKDLELPEGARWAPGYDIKDTGTGFTGVNRKTGVAELALPKDIVGKEKAEEVGKSSGQATVALPAAKTMVDNAFKTIGELRAHPGLDVGTGASTVFDPRSWIPGTSAYDFQAKNKQATGQSFMAARDALKGAGQVTDFEGAKGEQAIANLDTAQSKEQYMTALQTLEGMMKASYQDLQTKAGGGVPAPVMPPQGDVNVLKQKYGLE